MHFQLETANAFEGLPFSAVRDSQDNQRQPAALRRVDKIAHAVGIALRDTQDESIGKANLATHLALVACSLNHEETLLRLIQSDPTILEQIASFTNPHNILDENKLAKLVLRLVTTIDLTSTEGQNLAKSLSKVSEALAREKIRSQKRVRGDVDIEALFSSSIVPNVDKVDPRVSARACAILMHGPLTLLRKNASAQKKLNRAQKITLKSAIYIALSIPAAVTHGGMLGVLPKIAPPANFAVDAVVDKVMEAGQPDTEFEVLLTAWQTKWGSEAASNDELTQVNNFFGTMRQALFLLANW